MDSWLCIQSFTTTANFRCFVRVVVVVVVFMPPFACIAAEKFAFFSFLFGVCAFYCVIFKMNKSGDTEEKKRLREIVKERGVCV